MSTRIERKLIYKHSDGSQEYIRQDEIPAVREPVVILGDPGLGKSVLTEVLSEQPDMKYFRAGTFVRTANSSLQAAETDRVIVDGLDEIASATPGSSVEAVLEKLSGIGNPSFILSCREADWLGAADRVRIEDDYGVAPVLLHLQPFTREDARNFLSQEFPEIDVEYPLNHLADRGIETLYGNPLTLRLFGEVVQADGELPETRAQLFSRACRVMLREENPRHERDLHALIHRDELLLATGAICAAQVLCNQFGIYTGPSARTPDGFLHIADIIGLPHAQAANDALRTRLFQAEGENRFTYIHRVIAEYLGAKWITRCYEDGVSEKRIFALFRQGEGVPTSLRGLHAWMAHFSEVLAARCIDADPYAVLQYGDADTLSLDRARALLAALKTLSEQDPYFRSGDWGQHPASGLMRPELREEILTIVEATGTYMQLRYLLLEAMAESALARELAPTLETIMFDPERYNAERSCAWEALRTTDIYDNWEAVIHRLLEMQDADSARLACNILNHVGACVVSLGTVLDTVLAHLGYISTTDDTWTSHEAKYVPDRLFRDFDSAKLVTLLDGLIKRVKPLFDGSDSSPQGEFVDLVRGLTIRVLETDPAIAPKSIWSWIGWLDGNSGYNDNTRKRLVAIFRENRVLRVALLEYVLLTPCAENTWMAGYLLLDTRLELFPTTEDLAGVMKALHDRAGVGPVDADTFRGLLGLGRSKDGLAPILRDTAAVVANGDPKLLSILADFSDSSEPEWKTKQEKRKAAREKKRQRIIQSHRETLENRASDIAAGDLQVLVLPAFVYLGWRFMLPDYYFVESEDSPEERLRAFLGDALAEQVFAGFIAVLHRDDLPDATAIAKIRCDNKFLNIEALMICGVAEMLRQGRELDEIDRDRLAAVYMAWQFEPESNALGGLGIGSALEAVLFDSEADWEAHFRTSIEPQLARNIEHVQEFYRLANDSRFTSLAGRLSVKWLKLYPKLSLSNQQDLLACALDNTTHEKLRPLVVGRRVNTHPDHETQLLWLSADYVVDFDSCHATLSETAVEHPEFLWLVRERISPNRDDRLGRFSVKQLRFIVDFFGTQWQRIEPPTNTVITGDRNSWDATEFIEKAIFAIASRPKPEATEALQKLVAYHAPSYVNTLKHALALQLKARRDYEYTAPTIDELRAVVAEGLPESIDDMRAYFADRLDILQERMHGSNTNMWQAYWNEGEPKDENFCRDRMIEHISGQLPASIRFEPEMRMPSQTRSDIAAIRNTIGLPVEIKGQWHRDVWDAASDQLDANYTRDWHAEGRGVYIVLWFGNVSGKQLPGHPDGLARPETPEALRQMLVERLPEARRAWVDVFVVDVSRPR